MSIRKTLSIIDRLFLVWILVAGLTGSIALANPLFPGPKYRAGTSPSPVIGDFNGDGHKDFAVTDNFEDTVSVLLGNGNGTFTPETRYETGPWPTSVAIGDFNGDGHEDLAVANRGDWQPSDVSILLGNGNGTFSPDTRYQAGSEPSALAVGDFDGDGHEDLAVANSDADDISILVGNGDGSFGAETRFGVGSGPSSVTVGDFNGDGYEDLAVANGLSDDVSILLSTGDASFATETRYAAGGGSRYVAVGELNGDGYEDLAVANWLSDDVSVLLGNGDGTFAMETRHGAGDAPFSVAIGDLNGDGREDLALANYYSDDVSLLLGNGDGTFGAQNRFGAGAYPYSLAVGDLDDDGRQDLAVGNGDTHHLTILFGNGDGTFPTEARFDAGDSSFSRSSIAIGDFNADGRKDLAVANEASDDVSVLLGNGDGSFATEVRFGAGDGSRFVAVGNFNSDGHEDLAVANYWSGDISILPGNGDGTFGVEARFGVGDRPYSVAIGDFNSDGKSDLAVANLVSNDVSILLGNGNGTFATEVRLAAGDGSKSVAIGDFDNDGQQDLAVANQNSADVSILIGHGDGTFASQPSVPLTPWFSSLSCVATGDFNGDGQDDLVVTYGANKWLAVRLGNGDGTFGAPSFYETGGNPLIVTTGDLNQDGHEDLAVSNFDSQPYEQLSDVSVLLGNGDGTFAPEARFWSGENPNSLAIGDFNGDGREDLAVANSLNTEVTVLLNQLGPIELVFGADRSTLSWAAVASAQSYNVYRGDLTDLVDFNHDGLPDNGYGDCLNGFDDDVTDTFLVDEQVPGPGSGFFYLMSWLDELGQESGLGSTGAGLPREPQVPCP